MADLRLFLELSYAFKHIRNQDNQPYKIAFEFDEQYDKEIRFINKSDSTCTLNHAFILFSCQ